MSKTTLTIRVDPDLKTAVERIAKAEERSISWLVEKLIEECVAKAERSKKRKD